MRIQTDIRRTLGVGVLAFGGLLAAAGAAQAAVTTVSCPAPRIEREVTTSLPGEWRAVRNRSRLTRTRIAAIGGRDAMICEYGSAGTVQTYVPDGSTCRAVSGGFRCETAAAPAPAPGGAEVYSAGRLSIPQTYRADLDRGRVGGDGADIWFQAETSRRKFLVPINDTFISRPSRRSRGLDGCLSVPISANRIALDRLRPGSFVCYETRSGRIGELRVHSITGPASNQRLRIEYTTWR